MAFGINPGALGNLLSMRIHKSMFFDRARVISALSRSEFIGLSRGSLLVRRTAQKSIKKVGMAKPIPKVVGMNSGLSLADIARLPGMTTERAGIMRDGRGRFLRGSGGLRSREGLITEADRRKVLQRIREIKTKPPSAPGTPPHTHAPVGHMLGFRRNLYNAYDSSTHSAVAGPSHKGHPVPRLHEFGGTIKLVAWVVIPRWEPNRKPIIRWVSQHTPMGSRWKRVGKEKTVVYPPRPFMRPALAKCRPQLAELFRNTFRG
jgi:hypothetical protein